MSSLISPRWLLCAVVSGGLAPLRAADASDLSRVEAELAKKFAGVVEWQGIYDVSVIGAAARSGANGFHLESRYEAKGHGTFTLERAADDDWDLAAGIFKWVGKGEARGGGAGTFSEWDQRGIGEEWSQEFSGAVGQERIELSLGLKKKSVLLHAGVQRGEPIMRRTGRMVSAQGSGNQVSPINTTFPAPIDVWSLGVSDADQARRWQVVSNGPGVLAFTYEGPTAGRSQKFLVSGAGVIQRNKVILFPVYEDLEVEVTIADYAKWRPKGSTADPKKPGNTLIARATLKSKSGNAKGFPPIKEFRFELMDTSREPGVCLNWPLGAKDEDYDLRLAAASTGGDLSKRDQKLTVTSAPKDAQQRPYAEATVECFDFGARGELRVICLLEDGRELIGLMKDESGEQDIVRLPKMKGPDWIADVWREEKDVVKLAAGDDEEKVENQKHNGDGFTLYEEYRGWAVNGQHVEGDPKKKDFFVRNLIGADAKGGIALFQGVSKLRVHGKLRASEIIELPVTETESVSNAKGERIMNWNHRDAPHRVDQHAVILINTSGFRSSGGGTESVRNNDKTKRALRPGKARVVHVEERGRADGVFSLEKGTTAYALSEREAASAYDRGVAHELLHAVGVDHHGEGEDPQMFYFQGAGDPMNTAHRPRFVARSPEVEVSGRPASWSDFDRGPTVTLLWEDTGENVAQAVSAEFERELSAERANPVFERNGSGQAATFAQLGRDASFWSEMAIYNDVASGHTRRGLLNGGIGPGRFHRFVIVGREQEADSGNELCLMRYYFATAFPVSGRENTYYLVRPGGNRAGRELCKSPEGTGANASTHQPKSRFGDAAPGRGGCFQYICPNDAIPGRTL